MMQAVAQSGAGMSGASALHMNIFGLNPVVVFGTDEQKRRMLPPLIAGKDKACFAVTEPNAGLDTLKLKTKAVRDGDHYILSGQKIWISTAQVASKMLILARTTPLDEVKPPHRGLEPVLHRPRPAPRGSARDRQDGAQRGRLQRTVHRSAAGAGGRPHRRGGQGLRIHPARHEPRAHPDRGGGGRPWPRGAAQGGAYANERVVFDRPIGQNQAIQHPLAAAWMELEAADLMMFKAASLYDEGKPCGG